MHTLTCAGTSKSDHKEKKRHNRAECNLSWAVRMNTNWLVFCFCFFVFLRGLSRSFQDSSAFARLVYLNFPPAPPFCYFIDKQFLAASRWSAWSTVTRSRTLINNCKRGSLSRRRRRRSGGRETCRSRRRAREPLHDCVLRREKEMLGSIRTCWRCSWWSVKWGEKRANAHTAAEVTLQVNPSALIPVSARRTAVVIILKKNKLSVEAMSNFIQLSLSVYSRGL